MFFSCKVPILSNFAVIFCINLHFLDYYADKNKGNCATFVQIQRQQVDC